MRQQPTRLFRQPGLWGVRVHRRHIYCRRCSMLCWQFPSYNHTSTFHTSDAIPHTSAAIPHHICKHLRYVGMDSSDFQRLWRIRHRT